MPREWSSLVQSRSLRVVGLVTVSLGVLAIVVNALGLMSSGKEIAGVKSNQPARLLYQPASLPPADVKVETVAFDGERFEPASISRADGKFLLGIDDRSRKPEVAFELVREEDGAKVLEIRPGKKVLRHRKLVELQQGNYLLREVTDGKAVCRVSITN